MTAPHLTIAQAAVWLTPAEVYRVTKKKRWKAQIRALERRGYKKGEQYIVADDGEPLVFVHRLEASAKSASRRGHRWDRIGGVRMIGT